MSVRDTQDAGESTCYDGCASAWPPLTIKGPPLKGPAVTAALTFERDNEVMKVAANGWPLHYFQSDGSPSDVTGQGVNGVWWVLDAAGRPRRPDAETATETTDTY